MSAEHSEYQEYGQAWAMTSAIPTIGNLFTTCCHPPRNLVRLICFCTPAIPHWDRIPCAHLQDIQSLFPF